MKNSPITKVVYLLNGVRYVHTMRGHCTASQVEREMVLTKRIGRSSIKGFEHVN